ncbi:MAG: R2-like ligand-binding oxidase [Alicyclobacillus herbarius]|uniref:R2-like ligand-binding oxidase n=1 Tax=Alicyclobacillus herbarius TaxID=122960 RepID=UPI002353E29A|nr:R2-like ligand-binding oxidase [Alicyclobacillus herbarius]MCL6633029.1 R2-like ligand-binding oxidase [Alicyclobacillus herbarius]
MRNRMITTSPSGLKKDILPYRLYEKAKRLGVWNPRDLDFTQDKKDWEDLTNEQRGSILGLISKFQAGEEAVTLDLLPLMMAIAREGRLEEEMFLTTFLFEEAKHTEFFRLVLDVLDIHDDLSAFHTPTHRKVFYEILPETMQKLIHDPSPQALADASVVYNMFVEGMLAETGYFAFSKILENSDKMPGLRRGIAYLKRDESRHIAYGTFLLQRLIVVQPSLYDFIEQRMNELLPLAMSINQESMAVHDTVDSSNDSLIMDYAKQQYQLRLEKLQRAKTHTIEELYQMPEDLLGVL